MKDIPTEAKYFELQDFTKYRDYTFSLLMLDDFNTHLSQPIEDYIFSFMKDWIMYKWLQTKSPANADFYLENTEHYKIDLMIALSQRIKAGRRAHRLF